MKECIICHSRILDDAKFCGTCGFPARRWFLSKNHYQSWIEKTVIPYRKQWETREEEKQQKEENHPIEQKPEQPAEKTAEIPAAVSKPKKNRKGLIAVGAAAVILAAGIAIGVGFGSSQGQAENSSMQMETNEPAYTENQSLAENNDNSAGTEGDSSVTKDITDISVGVSMGTMKQERWAREAEMFQQYADDNGFGIDIQSANDDSSMQASQCENMINKGVDVLILQPIDGYSLSSVIDQAHDAGVKVIAYDDLILDSDVDYCVTFDSVKIGELEAQFVVDAAPKGNYIVLRGGPEDNNARLIAEGQDNILNPLIEMGAINVVTDQWCDGWDSNLALEHTENGLVACNNDLQGLIASDDGTCGGAIQALAEQGLDGKVPTCGQDADLAACQRIVEGTQTGTVFKPTVLLNAAVCQLAVACATGSVDEKGAVDYGLGTWTTLNNGLKDVDTFSVDVIAVTADNIYDVICKEYEYHSVEDVYANVPKSEWPE